jgi:hypothetical protein
MTECLSRLHSLTQETSQRAVKAAMGYSITVPLSDRTWWVRGAERPALAGALCEMRLGLMADP